MRSRWAYVAIFLLLLSVLGLANGFDEWPDAVTTGQKVASLTEVGYGILGPLAALALLGRWSGTGTLLWIWAVCLSVTAGLASIVWGDAPLWAGVLAGLSGALVALAVIWMSRRPAPDTKLELL